MCNWQRIAPKRVNEGRAAGGPPVLVQMPDQQRASGLLM
jgi:hypothetical protein